MPTHKPRGNPEASDVVRYDEGASAYKVDPATTREQGISVSVILAVSHVTGTGPNEQKPLDAVVNPDALDSFFDRTRESAGGATDCISFTYSGFRVTVYRDGEVWLMPRETPSATNVLAGSD